MGFPPQFLEDVRARLSLAEVVGRRVRLVRRGRDHVGLCPFHNEKSPSFTVFADHYHCFGCGAHGSAFDFVMQSEGLEFREAVERLAAELGMALPADTPDERRRSERRRTLHDVLEAATRHYEKALRLPEGRAALDYLARRGVGEDHQKRYRLGYAPDGRGGLKAALVREGFAEDSLVEAGLLVSPEDDNRPAYDRFRGRVMFPIADRQGRIVGFGGRTLGDREPKYLNSPETPLFHKGQLLYGVHLAAKAARDAGTIIVAEGYMDVISLSQAGFEHAVAPLGTALTAEQLQELWRLVPEPIVFFDPDEAGQRAAVRAAERALPIIRSGLGLRFAFIRTDTGDDPDGIARRYPAQFIREALANAMSLSDLLFWVEASRGSVRTAEDRAGLEARLRRRVMEVGDAGLRTHLISQFRERLRQDTRREGTERPGRRSRPQAAPVPASPGHAEVTVEWRRQAILLAVVIAHPESVETIGERLGALEFSDPDLDNLRQEVLKTLSSVPDLDSAGLQSHLSRCGHSNVLGSVLGPHVVEHAFFVRPGVAVDAALKGWEETYALHVRQHVRSELGDCAQRLAQHLSPEGFAYFRALKAQEQSAAGAGDAMDGGLDD